MFKRNKKINYRQFAPKPRPSRKKRVLVGTAIATAVLTISGVFARNQDQS